MPASKLLYAAILFAGSIGNILLSPKWVSPSFAWIAPACMLFYFRFASIRFKVLWFLLASVVSQMIASFDVAPFPLPILAIFSIVNIVQVFIVYLIDTQISKKSSHFITTLVFPAAFVTKEFFDMSASGGAWWSIANTQYSFRYLTQLSSVTGIVGISFIIYWFASVAVWSINKYFNKENFIKGLSIYFGVFLLVMIFGISRFYSNNFNNKPSVKIAGVSVPTISILENCYKDVHHQDISIDPKASLVSKKLQIANASLIPFIENPNPLEFTNAYKAMYQLHDSLFTLSQHAADKGAKIIVWSEGNAIMPTAMQDNFIQRGENFAAKNKVYLLMAIAAFQPGKLTPAKMFLENKAVFINPEGKVLNVFHKNNPVPFAERSVPGNGKIPAITTPYGTVSTSICYDADMPLEMKQLSQNKSDILLLPSGDWYDIAPYHSYMAVFRGIENGCSVVRQVSNGFSLVTDYRGKIQASFDYYKPGIKIWMADVVMGHVSTVYSYIGDAFAYLCIIITGLALLLLIVRLYVKKATIKGKRLNLLNPAC